MYEKLDEREILHTAERLARRVQERFPKAGLARVAAELCGITERMVERNARLREPHLPLRVGVAILILGAAAVIAIMVPEVRVNVQVWALSEMIQSLEALLGSLFFIGTGIAFLVTLESRLKRRAALAVVHELRSMAHIIDMHQLTKDPSELVAGGPRTASSPVRSMTDFELLRYLDYCCELLALVSKVGALVVQTLGDPVVLGAVDEVENLTTGLSRKIWQKISMLQRSATREKPRPPFRRIGAGTSGYRGPARA